MIELLKALSNHPDGIQITMYPDRAIIDLGYANHRRFIGETLKDAALAAATIVIRTRGPASVFEALTEDGCLYCKHDRRKPAPIASHCPEGKW